MATLIRLVDTQIFPSNTCIWKFYVHTEKVAATLIGLRNVSIIIIIKCNKQEISKKKDNSIKLKFSNNLITVIILMPLILHSFTEITFLPSSIHASKV